ncbi:alpha/beta hydrolase [Cryptosporangium aurantiacum]|uniref:Acetyl esterase/lipase n=1 Tax=Cryptosporangium aurantiacum TaxID=134849 RepID=A0A1M7R3L0_9ACTN|nr:alpha/beta hydrolase [Cryptosporangium aurantiacum]SHN39686.1 Acetyl esterase/lipase [Cryptosporangium aurantiacum]
MRATNHRWLGTLAVALILLGAAALPVPASASAIRVLTGIAYAAPQPATSQGHFLDLYLPTHSRQPTPLIIWVHGSGWMAENGRESADVVASHFVPRGYAVAGVSIRSSGFAQFPGQLYDIKAAIRFLRANAARYHLDPHRFGIIGESSGGWTAAMAAVTGDVPRLEGNVGVRGPSSRVQAAAPFYPPTDFLQMDPFMPQDCVPFNEDFDLTACHADPRSPESRLLGCAIEACPQAVTRADPSTYVSRNDPPMLLVHGQQDLYVPWQQSLLLYRAAARACADAALVLLPRGEHGQWNEFLTDPAVRTGARIQRTDDCRQTRPRPVQPSWNSLIQFFDRSLNHR